MMSSTIAIIGAGPKALAISVKNFVLNKIGFKTPRIVLIEKESIAHNWQASSGLTNGMLPLGTPPDKDLGFPYASFCWGDSQNYLVNDMMQRFSWQSYMVSQHDFAEWIDRGRPPITHQRWADYLKWTYKKIAHVLTLIKGEATQLECENGRWQITVNTQSCERETVVADGVVLTGPGELSAPCPVPQHPRVLNTANFWRNSGDFLSQRNLRVALVGSGENAATIATTLAQASSDNVIEIISPNAMNYTRGESYVENHIYTDPFKGNWHQFTLNDRINFINRTDRGVFSVVTKRELDRLTNVDVIPGRVESIRVDSLDQIVVAVEYNQDREQRIYDLVIVSSGFDPYASLTKMLSPRARKKICAGLSTTSLSRELIVERVSEDLALHNCKPKLHVPMLSGLQQGPGFQNLSCLGRLSDHILSSYVSLNSWKNNAFISEQAL